MRGIGPKSRQWLAEVGVDTIDQLRELGSEEVFRRVRQVRPEATLNLLWGLEGAVQDIHWADIDPERKRDLRRRLVDVLGPPKPTSG